MALDTPDERGVDRPVGSWLRDHALRDPQRPAVVFTDSTLTYAELDDRSTRLAAAMRDRGLRVGDRVATLTENRPEQVELLFACAKAGLALIPLNRFLTPTELAAQLATFAPAVVVASTAHRDRLAEACALAKVELLPATIEQLARNWCGGGEAAAPLAPVDEHAPLLVMPTSGSTGTPKGVILTHATCYWTNVSLNRSVPITDTDVVLQFLPQYHIGGWNVQPLQAWGQGATVVLEPKFDAAHVLELIEQLHVTTMTGVPTNLLLLAQHPRFDHTDLSSLRVVVVGGAAMPPTLLARWRARGVDVAQGYGLTEAGPNVLCLSPRDAHDHVGSVGKPYEFVDVALFDNDANTFVEGAGQGEIRVRGPNVSPGYWNNPEADAASFVDGWLRTGDVAERDGDGYYRISGRRKEMYVSGGENVYPVEVERTLCMHPEVTEAAVVPVDDAKWGERGAAFVVLRPDSGVTGDDLARHCQTLLASFKVPSSFCILPELPRTALGKIDKRQLVRRLSGETL